MKTKKTMRELNTTILCDHSRHTVSLKGDALSFACGDDVMEKAERVVALARLGRTAAIAKARGCAAFAIVVAAIPAIRFDGAADPMMGAGVDAGPFKPVYDLYKSNMLFQRMVEVHRKKLLAERADLDSALRLCVNKQLRKFWSGREVANASVRFAYDVSIEQLRAGWVVSSYDSDTWTVPYQPGWYEQIFEAGIGFASGRFVCGQDKDDPRTVYAIEKRDDGGFYVQPFRLEGKVLKAA
jgi:hypothetical protein